MAGTLNITILRLIAENYASQSLEKDDVQDTGVHVLNTDVVKLHTR